MSDGTARYYSFQFIDLSSNTVGYVSLKNNGNKAGKYTFMGPMTTYDTKNNMGAMNVRNDTSMYPLLTNAIIIPSWFVLIIARVRVLNPLNNLLDTTKVILNFQNKISIQKLNPSDSINYPILPNYSKLDTKTTNIDVNEYFNFFNQILTYHTGLSDDVKLKLMSYKSIGIGAGLIFNPNGSQFPQGGLISTSFSQAMTNGVYNGQRLISSLLAGNTGSWVYSNITKNFSKDPYVTSAIINWQYPYVNTSSEAIYAITYTDSDGKQLNGMNNYTLQLDSLPKTTTGFWSLTAYNSTTGLIDIDQGQPESFGNNIIKYEIPLKILFQYNSPNNSYLLILLNYFIRIVAFLLQSFSFMNYILIPIKTYSYLVTIVYDYLPWVKRTNWVPVPRGDFYIIMRIYGPATQTYKLPRIVKM